VKGQFSAAMNIALKFSWSGCCAGHSGDWKEERSVLFLYRRHRDMQVIKKPNNQTA